VASTRFEQKYDSLITELNENVEPEDLEYQ